MIALSILFRKVLFTHLCRGGGGVGGVEVDWKRGNETSNQVFEGRRTGKVGDDEGRRRR